MSKIAKEEKEKIVKNNTLNSEKNFKTTVKRNNFTSRNIDKKSATITKKEINKKNTIALKNKSIDLNKENRKTTVNAKKISNKNTLKSKKTSSTNKKSTIKKRTYNKKLPQLNIIEYYDLPYKYGNTIVRLLAQTPKTLFVYWEISDKDIEKYKKKFGDDFFNITKPILIVHNITLKKTYEVEINDFANCWYLNTEEPDCEYDIELARKFISSPLYSKYKKNDYLNITKSNTLISPNDHILFEKLIASITFKNVKTGESIIKDIKSYSFLQDLYSFYKSLYKDEILFNPSSNFLIY